MAQEKPKKTKFFRIATEGATTDGRTIDRTMLEQIARSYDPMHYGARINLEHIRGILPDSPFRAYGDVIAVRTEEQDGKLRLLAQLSPTTELVTLTRQRQKVYTSMEIDPDFAESGEAYLVALAVTDNPASLGTEMLEFSAKSKALDARKQSPDNLISAAVEADIELDDDTTPTGGDAGRSLFSKVRGLLAGKSATDNERFSDIAQSIEVLADSQRQVLDRLDQFGANVEALKRGQQAADTRHDELITKLSRTDSRTEQRPTSTGGSDTVLTDC
jgi:hypothetical protein